MEVIHIRRLYISIALYVYFVVSYSQDIHFTQIAYTPVYINPGMTGLSSGDIRAFLNYKNQWESISSPYRTYAFAFDYRFANPLISGTLVGTGLTLLADRAGDADMTTYDIQGMVSVIVPLSAGAAIAGGIKGGILQKSVNPTKEELRWNLLPGGVENVEGVPSRSLLVPDISVGLGVSVGSAASTLSSMDYRMVSFGVSYNHIINPKNSFILEYADKLSGRFSLNALGFWGFRNTNFAVVPSLVWHQQGVLREIVGGLLVRYQLRQASVYTSFFKESGLYIGGYYRVGDAISPSLVFEYSEFMVGVSYDINVSPLRAATSMRGGIDIFLRYMHPSPFSGREYQVGHKTVRFL